MKLDLKVTPEGEKHFTLGGMMDMERILRRTVKGVRKIEVVDLSQTVLTCDPSEVFNIMHFVRTYSEGCVRASAQKKVHGR